MKRDTTIVVGALVALVVIAIAGHKITGDTLLLLAVVVPSIILHEVSHGLAALAYGDETAKQAGRLTLNPIKHIDPVGTIILPALLAVSGFAVFGYAKPVPISPGRMRHPRNNALVVSLAGPATNIALALVALIFLRGQLPGLRSAIDVPMVVRVPYLFGTLNVVLAVFNLIPIPPLDGSAVVERFLPDAWRAGWPRFRRYAPLVLLMVVLFQPGILARVFNPAIDLWARGLGA